MILDEDEQNRQVSLLSRSREDSLSSCTDDNPHRGKVKRRRVRSREMENDNGNENSNGQDVDPLNCVRKERENLERFLFNDINKISKPAIKNILSMWMNLENKVQELVIENSKLKTQLNCNELYLPEQRSYAQVLGSVSSSGVVPGSPVKSATKKEKPKSEILIIKPVEKEDKRTVDELKSGTLKKLEHLRNKLKINNVRQTRQKGLLMEVNSKEDINLIKNANLGDIGLKAEEPRRLKPSLIIYDVEKDLTVEELKLDLVEKNIIFKDENSKLDVMGKIDFVHKFPNKTGRLNWIVNLPGTIYKELISKGYGHIAKNCSSLDPLCEYCGKNDHCSNDCANKEKPTCINCFRSKRKETTHSNRVDLKVGQINGQRSAAVAAELDEIIRNEKIDILCVQEPYVYKEKVKGYSDQVILQPQTNYPWVAIIVANKEIEAFQILYEQSEHIMTIEFNYRNSKFYIINAYCQYSHPIYPFIQSIEKIIRKLITKKIIITADVNANSVLWYSDTTNERGRLVEELIVSNCLYIANQYCDTRTFSNQMGTSNIDVTLASNNVIANIIRWKVENLCTLSDHNLITFRYSDVLPSHISPITRSSYYKIRNTKLDKFLDKFNEIFNQEYLKYLELLKPDRLINKVSSKLHGICGMTIPKIRKSVRSVPWWNNELSKTREETFKVKKELARARRLKITADIENLIIKYRIARNKLTAQIRKAKKNSWRNYVTEKGNTEPWGVIYKIIKDKSRSAQVMTSIFSENQELTLTLEETVQTLLITMVPVDDCRTEEEVHRAVKEENSNYRNYNLEPEISIDEIEHAVVKSKDKKAPGIDRIRVLSEEMENS
ncbi:hypothetical protein KPH14_012899 [Odynerus spinipes]|uniref:Endonuclease/exonuclease/phosphatase domain-containing protein n=1 Tax=Odynerus spinipes TaxID=1348599 RepID=A0AAD9R9K0_9HYME|nr:hypothetical protein KPH14_012899 [Odynerus spinipes]